jgi:predicted chitinase
MDARFFDTVRPIFGGKLTQGQVDGMNRIVEYGAQHNVPRVYLAYILASIKHETASWMWPIREGARRYGTNYTDAQSRRAVEILHAKGIIRRNYALPDRSGNSFYGRGLIQITHKGNYAKFGIEDSPDAALDWDKSLEIAFKGTIGGMFTGKALGDYLDGPHPDYKHARAVVNGDVRKNGVRIARHAKVFYDALEGYTPRKEVPDEPSTDNGTWPPRWWPFPTD